MTERLTILRTTPTPHGAPRYATKRWSWNATLNDWRSIAYDAGATFTAEERPVSGLDDVAAALEGIRRDPTAFIVRGELLPEARAAVALNPGHRIRRAKKEGKRGQAPTLAECARRWLMVDVDNYPLPGWADLADDPEAAIEAAIHDLLPEQFHDARCFWQLSASAGFKPGVLKVHLFFWLAEPIINEDLKLYLQVHAPAVDRAPFNAAQPHYIADPIVENGHDPLPRRTGWIKGLGDAVELPALDLAELQAAVRARRERVAAGAGLDASAARTVAGALALLGDDEGHEGWHGPLRRATLLYARQTAEKARDDGALKQMCRAAVDAAAEREAARLHSAADLARMRSDAYLDDLIDGAFAWVKANKSDATAGMNPFHEAPAHGVEDARAAVQRQIQDVLRDTAAWHAKPKKERGQPRQVGLAVDVGTGKSRAGRLLVAGFSAEQKAEDRPHRILWLGPTIKLGTEAEAHFADMEGVAVVIHRGREQPDPLEPGQAMCLDLAAVMLATTAGESVEKAVCGGGREGAARCPFFEKCGYQRQRRPVAAADVVIAAHEAAFHLPAGIKKNLALTVFDEAWWQDGLRTARPIKVEGMADGVLANPVFRPIPGGRQVQDLDATDELHVLRTRLQRALQAAPAGYVQRETLVAAGITVEDCATARKHEWSRKILGLMRPGMAPKDRAKAAAEAGVNAQLPRFAAMWTIFADLLSSGAAATGRAEMMWRPDRDGEVHRVVSLNLMAGLVGPVVEAPVLLLDATMPADLVRSYLPRLEAAPAVRVKAPFMEVRQVRGGWGKTTLLPNQMVVERTEDGAFAAPLPPALAELRDFVAGETRGERALVITYQDAEQAFAGLPGVETAHFNDVSGRDQWGPGPGREGVRHLFVIGQPRPRSDQVRELAAALTGEPVEAAESHREARGVRMADGTGATLEVRAYANPAAEGVSAAITDAEVVQAIGRARGINRTAEDPVRVWIMADVVTPLVVDELLDWRDLAPSAVERMACRGVVLASPADAHAAYRDLFSTPKAAEHALKRAGVGKGDFPPNPLRISLLRGMGAKSVLGFSYRPPGRGQQTRRGWARPDMDPEDVWRWLEGHLGELAVFQPDDPPPDPPPVPHPPERQKEPAMAEAGSGPEPSPQPGHAPAAAGTGSGGDEPQLEPEGPAPGGEVGLAEPENPARRPPEAVNGSEGAWGASDGPEPPPGPPGPVHEPSAAAAAPAGLQAVRLLQQRLQLAGLAERLRDARPKRTYNVRALDWAVMEDAARAVAELPTPAWRTWREEAGPEGVVLPRTAGSVLAENAHR